VPTAQLEQTEADAAENKPDEHAPVTAVKPVVEQYEPAAQGVHELELDEA